MQTAVPLFSCHKATAAGIAPAAYLPTSRAEMDALGWQQCDVIIVTGDAYVDHPSFGMAIIGRLLEAQGFKNVPVEDIVRTKDHGVSAEFVADMKEIGLKDLTLPQLVRLRDHGITPGFVNHARARGYKTTDPEELVRLKNGGLWKD